MEKLLYELRRLDKIPNGAVREYEEKKEDLMEYVNLKMEAHPKIDQYLGESPKELMYNNNRNHVEFMTNVFKFNDFEMLARVLPGIYRSYMARDFLPEYFIKSLEAWQEAIGKILTPLTAKAITPVYVTMGKLHQEVLLASKDEANVVGFSDNNFPKIKERFLHALLDGDHIECMNITKEFLFIQKKDIKRFYLGILQPALYEIGRLWEYGQISVAEEHLATAIAGRVMASVYNKFYVYEKEKGKVIVTCSPNEFHEVGGRMIADALEFDGWDVHYMGANVPIEELLLNIEKISPNILAISTAMPFNLDATQHIVERVRKEFGDTDLKIMVGGLAFAYSPNLWEQMGADGWGGDVEEAIKLARGWWADNEKT
ncbi:cobalamin-dependent protein [Proteinivorax hydrogeniformans]|uniref:Cobalamin-dependent protein n=1 Tax=Proteinivorax hydrogeniformans TaxID=1826727 RepID=A0AAU8HUK7_9FIRM